MSSPLSEGPASLPSTPLPLDFAETLPLAGEIEGAQGSDLGHLRGRPLRLDAEGEDLLLYASGRLVGRLAFLGLEQGRRPDAESAARNASLIRQLLRAGARLDLDLDASADDRLLLAVSLPPGPAF